MPTWTSVAAFTADFDKMIAELSGPEKRKITRAQGEAAQKIAAKQATQDLGGDRAFSGFVRGKPIPAETQLRNLADGNTMLTPKGRGAAAVWTIAEQGRNAAAGPRLVGPRLTRTGRVSKARQRRYNGRTRGKHTATDAVQVMEKELPKIADKAVNKVIRKRFDVTGG